MIFIMLKVGTNKTAFGIEIIYEHIFYAILSGGM